MKEVNKVLAFMETKDITQTYYYYYYLLQDRYLQKNLVIKTTEEGKGSTLVEEKVKWPGCTAKKRHKQARKDKI